jgi:hypothetical protein
MSMLLKVRVADTASLLALAERLRKIPGVGIAGSRTRRSRVLDDQSALGSL